MINYFSFFILFFHFFSIFTFVGLEVERGCFPFLSLSFFLVNREIERGFYSCHPSYDEGI